MLPWIGALRGNVERVLDIMENQPLEISHSIIQLLNRTVYDNFLIIDDKVGSYIHYIIYRKNMFLHRLAFFKAGTALHGAMPVIVSQ